MCRGLLQELWTQFFLWQKTLGGQACGWAAPSHTIGFAGPLVPGKIEALAIARCEEAKPASIKAPCKIFAVGNKIVWGEKTDIEMQ